MKLPFAREIEKFPRVSADFIFAFCSFFMQKNPKISKKQKSSVFFKKHTKKTQVFQQKKGYFWLYS